MSSIVKNIDNFFLRKRVYLFLKHVLDHWVFKTILILLVGLNAYIMFVLGNDDNANYFKENFKFFYDIVFNNAGKIVIISSIVMASYNILLSFLTKKSEDLQGKYNALNKKYDIAIQVLENIESVVAAKRTCYAEVVEQHLNTPHTPKIRTIFNKIVLPNEQIQLLINSLRTCLMGIYPNEYIKIALVEVKNSQIQSWVCHSPYDTRPRTHIDVLKDSNSTFSKCIEKRKIVIIPSTQTEIKKTSINDRMFIQGNTDPDEEWCQVCTPVKSITTNEIIFIISIAIKRENVILKENEVFLTWVLKHFESRLALEHSLSQLKGRV